mmetsp:Transcript_12990/g.29474  ORF Transcript_12990/g.29474 Transcript_12990/m.29474 type:complete len:243 (-) Transcript_12990:1036-1764(-)
MCKLTTRSHQASNHPGNLVVRLMAVLSVDSLELIVRCCHLQAPNLLLALAKCRLSVPRKLCHAWRPSGSSTEQLIAEQKGCCYDVRGRVADHGNVKESQLQQVVDNLRVRIIAIVLVLQPGGEMRCCGKVQLEVQSLEHDAFHVQDVLLEVRPVCDVDEITNLGWRNLLELGCKEHGHDPNQLQPSSHHRHPCQVAVNQADCQVERLTPQLVLHVHLNEPINKDPSHTTIDVTLMLHVVRNG